MQILGLCKFKALGTKANPSAILTENFGPVCGVQVRLLIQARAELKLFECRPRPKPVTKFPRA